MLVEVVRQAPGPFGVHVENSQLFHAFAEQRVGNRRARTASPHLDYALHGNPFQATAKTFSEAQAVGRP